MYFVTIQAAGAEPRSYMLERQAARAARRAEYEDAQARFARLGYTLTRKEKQFALFDPRGARYAMTADLAPHLRTLATFEAGAATRAAETAAPADTWHNLPPLLAGWKWQTNTTTTQVSLAAPDGSWQTKDYTHSGKAIAEALRRVNSQPKPAPTPSTWQERQAHTPADEIAAARMTAIEEAAWHIVELADHGSMAAAVSAALALARELAGDDLDALAAQLDDAEYEALARLCRVEESEVGV